MEMIKKASHKVKGSIVPQRIQRVNSQKESYVREKLLSKGSSRQDQASRTNKHHRIIKQSTVKFGTKVNPQRMKSCILDPKVCSTHLLMEFFDNHDSFSKKENENQNFGSFTFSTADEFAYKENHETSSHNKEHILNFNPLSDFLCFGKSPIMENHQIDSNITFLDLDN